MRFFMLVKATKDSEAGIMPTDEMISMMGKYNEELQKAGVLLDLGGLQPTSRASKVRYDGKKRTVVDGPFAEAKEMIAGYWLIQVKSREEALEWAKRVPFEEGEVELRPLFDFEDFEPGPGVEAAKKLGAEMEQSKKQ
jgi:hypothetical protein